MVRWSEDEFKFYLKSKGKSKHEKKPSYTPNRKVVVAGGYTSNWSGKATFGGKCHFYRSLWEHNYARFLEWQKAGGHILKWDYEPKRFCFKHFYNRAPYDYLPDFRITNTDGSHEWHEVKGFLNSKSKTKISRFEKHYPEEGSIILIDKSWFSKMSTLSALVPGWMSLKDALALSSSK